ncbi:hypothetical protein ACS2B2_25640 [Bacillus cereus group sp. BceL297]|uniref:hypothetical protein n=1 Tax=unclassified Bacillus cereus group TaxID=2750818 RepID=UPI003F260E76
MGLMFASPFIKRGIMMWFGFVAMLFVAGSLYFDSDSGFMAILVIALFFGIPAYRKSENKKHTEAVLLKEVQEASTFKVVAHHRNLGFGYLGTTKNYVFFVPNKKREEAVIINSGYLTNIESTMQKTGDYVSIHDNMGSVTSAVRFPVFIAEGTTPEGEQFGYAFVTDGMGKANKMFSAVEKNPNAPQKSNERRKFI